MTLVLIEYMEFLTRSVNQYFEFTTPKLNNSSINWNDLIVDADAQSWHAQEPSRPSHTRPQLYIKKHLKSTLFYISAVLKYGLYINFHIIN